MASIYIIYGSTSGNTEMVCHKVSQVLEAQGHSVKLSRAELCSIDEISKYDLCILGASTYGHGIIQDHMIPVVAQMKKMKFKNQKFAVIGLGDTKYDAHYNIESGIILEDLVSVISGELLYKSLMINKNPMWQLKAVEQWAQELNVKLIDTK